jgi:serine/threonine-protein kinase 24/25/MST4
LLKHRFIKGAKKTSYLVELIERYERWVAEGNNESSSSEESNKSDDEEGAAPSWDFGTVAKNDKGKAMAAAVKEQSGDAMLFQNVVAPILTKLGEKAPGAAKPSVEALKKDFEAVEKAQPGFTHNFVSEILDLMKSKK